MGRPTTRGDGEPAKERSGAGQPDEGARPTRIRFRTDTGSLYELRHDGGAMRWERLSATLAAGVLRSEAGTLLVWPTVEVGVRCELWSEPYLPPWPRLVLTSVVVELLPDAAQEGPVGGPIEEHGRGASGPSRARRSIDAAGSDVS